MPELNKKSMDRAVISDDQAAIATGGDGGEQEIPKVCIYCKGNHSSLSCPLAGISLDPDQLTPPNY